MTEVREGEKGRVIDHRMIISETFDQIQQKLTFPASHWADI